MKKLAIHDLPCVAANGNTFNGLSSWFIYVGSNPLGPSGGSCGNVASARRVTGPFRSYIGAEEYAEREANLAVLERA